MTAITEIRNLASSIGLVGRECGGSPCTCLPN